MKNILKVFLTVFISTLFFLTSCNFPLTNTATAATEPQGISTVETAAPQADASTTPITHSVVPPEPVYMVDQVAKDCNTGARLQSGSDKIIIDGCDYWNRVWLERPADTSGGTYEPAVDILWSQAGKSDPWLYFRIMVSDLSNMPQGYKAGFELDTNLDSRGEFLLLVQHPSGTSWSVNGVQVWQDTNGDVGGSQPFHYDPNKGDGYETRVFDSGSGADPDLAWARISPNDPNTIEFALKASLLTNPNVVAWWAWTGLDTVSPGQFELVDHLQDSAVWSVDNTCSWIMGQKPTANQLANLCALVVPTPTATATNRPGNKPTRTPTPIIIR